MGNSHAAEKPMAPKKPRKQDPKIDVVVTCEHASNDIPALWKEKLAIPKSILATHRAWDPGTPDLGKAIAKSVGTKCRMGKATRLLVDLNRSPDNPAVFSKWSTKNLSTKDREKLLQSHHGAFWRQTRAEIDTRRARSKCEILHVSVHSFTPVLRGERRRVDIGILYDPERAREAELATKWLRHLQQAANTAGLKNICIAANEPYLGISDAHTTSLRGTLNPDWYSGVEIEVNQKIVRQGGKRWRTIIRLICDSLVMLLETPGANSPKNSKAADRTRPVRGRIPRRVSSRRAKSRR
jgi:predicted N-formylglutamate amidohydrolase